VAIIWGVYITLYNSRVVGAILTFFINKLYRDAYIKFGKVMLILQCSKDTFSFFKISCCPVIICQYPVLLDNAGVFVNSCSVRIILLE